MITLIPLFTNLLIKFFGQSHNCDPKPEIIMRGTFPFFPNS